MKWITGMEIPFVIVIIRPKFVAGYEPFDRTGARTAMVADLAGKRGFGIAVKVTFEIVARSP
jgi:hypothetical protein